MQRDLASVDVWEESLRRSRERRQRAGAQRQRVELPARGVSLAAALALTGGSAAAAAAGDGWDTDVEAATLAGSGAAPPAVEVQRAVAGAAERTAQVSPPELPLERAVAAAAVEREAPAGLAPSGKASGTASTATAPARGTDGTATAGGATASTATASTSTAGRATAGRATAGRATASTATAGRASAGGTTATASAARRGGGVKALQRALGVPADGDFGPATERALKRWQRRHGLTADGIAGPQTRRALGLGDGAVLKRERTRSRGRRSSGRARRGGGVVALQRALGVSADGVFGPGTESALKRWQRRHGLVADGVAGPQTRRALGLGPGPLLKRKSGGGGGSGGRGSSTLQRVVAAANAIATKPYEYGGGHGSFSDDGYDCSGSVSYALHGGGLLSTPLDSTGFMSYGRPGPGRYITIYANPGHVYMTINGRRFDTSARRETGSRWTSVPRSSSGYVVRHPPGL